MATALQGLTAARHVNRLFATHVARHDENAQLAEHRLVVDHLALGDGPGAAVALRHHIEADHIRTRARLRVLSVIGPLVSLDLSLRGGVAGGHWPSAWRVGKVGTL
jgi:hypothetical protein